MTFHKIYLVTRCMACYQCWQGPCVSSVLFVAAPNCALCWRLRLIPQGTPSLTHTPSSPPLQGVLSYFGLFTLVGAVGKMAYDLIAQA